MRQPRTFLYMTFKAKQSQQRHRGLLPEALWDVPMRKPAMFMFTTSPVRCSPVFVTEFASSQLVPGWQGTWSTGAPPKDGFSKRMSWPSDRCDVLPAEP